MFADIMTAVSGAYAAPLNWFVEVISSLSAEDVYLGIIFMVLTAGFLLKPLRGSGSDKAKKSKIEEGDEE